MGRAGRQTWQDLAALAYDGIDVEPHTMTMPI